MAAASERADREDHRRDVHPFDGEGLLGAEEASKLLGESCGRLADYSICYVMSCTAFITLLCIHTAIPFLLSFLSSQSSFSFYYFFISFFISAHPLSALNRSYSTSSFLRCALHYSHQISTPISPLLLSSQILSSPVLSPPIFHFLVLCSPIFSPFLSLFPFSSF